MIGTYLAILSMLLAAVQVKSCNLCSAKCPTNDCIKHDVSEQTKCVEVTSEPARKDQCEWWANGLASHTDVALLGGKIVAYKIQWFSGSWSGWFVPGVNDVDCKYNNYSKDCKGKTNCKDSLRRWWSYFYDHTHTYIICKP